MAQKLNLQQALAQAFSIAELDQLCVDLGINPESVRGSESTIEGYSFKLIAYAQRHGILPNLTELCTKLRPQIVWDQLSVPDTTAVNPGKLGDSLQTVINTQGGAGVSGTVNAQTFIGRDQTFIGQLIVNPWAWVAGLLIIAGAVVLVGLASNVGQLQSLLPTPSPLPTALPTATATAFAPAKDDESLIIVAHFDNRSEGKYKGIEPAQYIYDELRKQAKEDNLALRVEHLHTVIDEKTARTVGETYSATLLLWGWYNGLSVKPVIERIRDQLGTRASLDRLSIANSTRIEAVITNNLPNQTSYIVLLTLGLEQYASGNLIQASRYFDAIIGTPELEQASAAHRGEVYHWRAKVYRANGDLDNAKTNFNRAVTYYSQAIVAKPNEPDILWGRGLAFYALGDFNHAISDFSEAIKLNPSYIEPYRGRGSAYIGREEYSNAIADFTQLLKLEPDDVRAYYNRGLAYYLEKNFTYAIADYSQAIKLTPDNPDIYYNRGLAFFEKGDLKQAISDYSQTIKLRPDLDTYFNRALAFEETGDLQHAIADYDQVIKLKPDDPDAYCYRGNAYKAFKKNKEAIEDLKKCLEISIDLSQRSEISSEITKMLLELGFQ